MAEQRLVARRQQWDLKGSGAGYGRAQRKARQEDHDGQVERGSDGCSRTRNDGDGVCLTDGSSCCRDANTRLPMTPVPVHQARSRT